MADKWLFLVFFGLVVRIVVNSGKHKSSLQFVFNDKEKFNKFASILQQEVNGTL